MQATATVLVYSDNANTREQVRLGLTDALVEG